MAFKKTEKDILKAIVKYGEGEHSMAKVLNKSKLLEKNGIVIAFGSNRNYVFYDKNKYEWEDGNALSYVSELISLIKHLIDIFFYYLFHIFFIYLFISITFVLM